MTEDKKEEAEVFSHSRLWLYQSCPEFYRLKYIDRKVPEMPLHMSLFLGSATHEALEWLYHQVKNREVELDEVIEYFTEIWTNGFSDGIRMVNGDEKMFYNKGVKFLVDYYFKHKPFKEEVVAIERKILFPLDEEGKFKIQGYIDRLDLKDGVYEIHDYKTNAYLKSQEDIDADKQLALYHLGLKELYGDDIKVRLVWHFLAFNQNIVSQRTEEQLVKLKKDTLDLIKKIKSTTEWSACKKKWCDWCEYKRVNEVTYEDVVREYE